MKMIIPKKRITVDVVSDVACPWCYIGKKRLEAAIATLEDDFEFRVTFHPFQLDPSIPASGTDRKTYFENKFGENTDHIFDRVESAGHSVGVDFKFREIPVMPNTLPLHMLLKAAQTEGIQLQVANTLFEAYMVNPKNLAEQNTLVELMATFGWSEAKTIGVLSAEVLKTEILTEMNLYKQMGITGVPFFIINNKYGISGAQPTGMFISAFKEMKEEDFVVQEQNDACAIDGDC